MKDDEGISLDWIDWTCSRQTSTGEYSAKKRILCQGLRHFLQTKFLGKFWQKHQFLWKIVLKMTWLEEIGKIHTLNSTRQKMGGKSSKLAIFNRILTLISYFFSNFPLNPYIFCQFLLSMTYLFNTILH